MFEITTNDIERLDDETLRELVYRLAAAEIQQQGHHPLAVRWGGNQTAPDGGVDVAVELPSGAYGGPGLPCPNTSYQVKKSDLARADILDEMRPHGQLRASIRALAAINGAYLIISSGADLSDIKLRNRRGAMREALHDCPNADGLVTDFFDQRRLADWVNLHPGVVPWVRERSGRSVQGWQPYGAWSNRPQGEGEPYLPDARLRLHIGGPGTPRLAVIDAIGQLRAMLAAPRKVVRLVGVSGAGKTRLVQALFDVRLGQQALPTSEALYVDFTIEPAPTPLVLATNLVAQGRRAILIIDNCVRDLHEKLAEVCDQTSSKLSLITIEYALGEGAQEKGRLVTMDVASKDLIRDLLYARFPLLSHVAISVIAEASGGNSRIALAIAATVECTDNLAGLSPSQLFDRLFWQRNHTDLELLQAAQACALVYSFEGELQEGVGAELPHLAALAGLTCEQMYRHVATLFARDLVQRRAQWRAVLPDALANHLAASALKTIMPGQIRRHLIEAGNERLLLSFTHRLGSLHTEPGAVALAEGWMRPGEMLGDVAGFGSDQHKMFMYLAPVAPASALAALERLAGQPGDASLNSLNRYRHVIRLIAYDAALFGRCIELLQYMATDGRIGTDVTVAVQLIVSFFHAHGAGTRATAEQRYALVERWLAHPDARLRALGQQALGQALSHKRAGYYAEAFGARPREPGYLATNSDEFVDWIKRGLDVLDGQLQAGGGAAADDARDRFAVSLPWLWQHPQLRERVEALMTSCAAGGFWPGGWNACLHALRHYSLDAAATVRLQELVELLAPVNLTDRVTALVLARTRDAIDRPRGEDHATFQSRLEGDILALGREAAHDLPTLCQLLPALLRCGNRSELLARGLAADPAMTEPIWAALVGQWVAIPCGQRKDAVMRGFVGALAQRDSALANRFLDRCLFDPALMSLLPSLQSVVGFDLGGIARLQVASAASAVPVEEYKRLAGLAFAPAEVREAGTVLLLAIARREGGFPVALEVLFSWLAVAGQGSAVDALRPICRQVLVHARFSPAMPDQDYQLAGVASAALTGPDGVASATALVTLLRATAHAGTVVVHAYGELLQVLLQLQPIAVLTALCAGDDDDRDHAVAMLSFARADGRLPMSEIDAALLLAWCADEPVPRYRFASRIVPVVAPEASAGSARLTAQASALLGQSPDPVSILQVLAGRMRPDSWSGSRAAILARNAVALEAVLGWHGPDYQAYARRAMADLLDLAAQELEFESGYERARDERFE